MKQNSNVMFRRQVELHKKQRKKIKAITSMKEVYATYVLGHTSSMYFDKFRKIQQKYRIFHA